MEQKVRLSCEFINETQDVFDELLFTVFNTEKSKKALLKALDDQDMRLRFLEDFESNFVIICQIAGRCNDELSNKIFDRIVSDKHYIHRAFGLTNAIALSKNKKKAQTLADSPYLFDWRAAGFYKEDKGWFTPTDESTYPNIDSFLDSVIHNYTTLSNLVSVPNTKILDTFRDILNDQGCKELGEQLHRFSEDDIVDILYIIKNSYVMERLIGLHTYTSSDNEYEKVDSFFDIIQNFSDTNREKILSHFYKYHDDILSDYRVVGGRIQQIKDSIDGQSHINEPSHP